MQTYALEKLKKPMDGRKHIDFYVDLYPGWQNNPGAAIFPTNSPGSKPPGMTRVKISVGLPEIGFGEDASETGIVESIEFPKPE